MRVSRSVRPLVPAAFLAAAATVTVWAPTASAAQPGPLPIYTCDIDEHGFGVTGPDGTKSITGQNCQADPGAPTSGRIEDATVIQPRDDDLAYICNGTVLVHQNILNGQLEVVTDRCRIPGQ
ncbi:hypothetical protein NONO_c37710 [Nocardia nova SH22a]|uniref:Secreted protein n=1 Tax=Nocardia nova SH22a TaxID=1415166 RepID=W5TGR4_9NOCA|nr:hypothetical protein [Nocardia nova]AHH18555.1 hypothetical protein NONO_c37710 [Nocardia nova SH22a]